MLEIEAACSPALTSLYLLINSAALHIVKQIFDKHTRPVAAVGCAVWRRCRALPVVYLWASSQSAMSRLSS